MAVHALFNCLSCSLVTTVVLSHATPTRNLVSTMGGFRLPGTVAWSGLCARQFHLEEASSLAQRASAPRHAPRAPLCLASVKQPSQSQSQHSPLHPLVSTRSTFTSVCRSSGERARAAAPFLPHTHTHITPHQAWRMRLLPPLRLHRSYISPQRHALHQAMHEAREPYGYS